MPTPPSALQRAPAPALRGLVRQLWSHDPGTGAVARPGAREHVLPTGATHLVLRLSGPPLTLFEPAGHCLLQRRVGHAVVGGARAAYYVRDVSAPAASVGALLQPGAARVLLGVPESALAAHHTLLDLLLGAEAVAALTEQLQAATGHAARLRLFERWLADLARGRPPALHPLLMRALGDMRRHADWPVARHVQASGLSHRHFIARFREGTGLAPREYLGLMRFNRTLALAGDAALGWAEIAHTAGYADQSHLAHVFAQVAGVAPQRWRMRALAGSDRHVPV